MRIRGTRKQRWSDLSDRQRAAIVVAGAVQNGLLAAALIDLRRRPAEQVNGSKWRWAVISLVSFAGPIAYFALGRKREPATLTPAAGSPPAIPR